MLSSKLSKSFSTLTLALTFLLLALTLTWLLSLRPIRLKIGDYYFKQEKFDQAANWYGKVVRKLRPEDHEYDRYHAEALSKLSSSQKQGLESTLFLINKLFGRENTAEAKPSLADPKFLRIDIKELPGLKSKKTLKETRAILNNFFYNLNVYQKQIQAEPNCNELGFLASIGYFLNGIIAEAESHFISADSNYEKAGLYYPALLDVFEDRRAKILPQVTEEYSIHSPSLRRIGNSNVLLDSETPLVVTGIAEGVDNYLEYETYPAKIILRKYSVPRLRLEGEVFGKNKEKVMSCIIPRAVFWGPGGYLGEMAAKYPIEGTFDIVFPLTIPEKAVKVTSRITFDGSCFSEHQRILLKEFKWE